MVGSMSSPQYAASMTPMTSMTGRGHRSVDAVTAVIDHAHCRPYSKASGSPGAVPKAAFIAPKGTCHA